MVCNRLNGLDVSFLCLDDRSAPMNIGLLAVYEPPEPIETSELVALIAGRLEPVGRFRLRARPRRFPPGAVEWVPCERFQIQAHLRVHHLTRPGTGDHLADYVARTLANQLDPTRPLWELHVITGLDDGAFALLAKTHHALADGMGVAYLVAALMDGAQPQTDPPGAGQGSFLGNAWRTLSRPGTWLTTPAAIATQMVGDLTDTARRTACGLGVAASVLGKARVAPDSPLLGSAGRVSLRRELHSARLTRDAVRQVCERHQVTTNDVVLAVLTGALRRWLEARGHPVGEWTPRALVPVDLRALGASDVPGSGNVLSGYLCELPVSEPDPVRRLRSVHATMEANKAAGPYRGPGAVATLAGVVPDAFNHVIVPLLGANAGRLFDLVVTSGSLPGGTWPVAGAAMRENLGIAPLAKGQGLSVAVAKAPQHIGISLFSDPSILPDVTTLRDAVPLALAEYTPETPSDATRTSTGSPVSVVPSHRRPMEEERVGATSRQGG